MAEDKNTGIENFTEKVDKPVTVENEKNTITPTEFISQLVQLTNADHTIENIVVQQTEILAQVDLSEFEHVLASEMLKKLLVIQTISQARNIVNFFETQGVNDRAISVVYDEVLPSIEQMIILLESKKNKSQAVDVLVYPPDVIANLSKQLIDLKRKLHDYSDQYTFNTLSEERREAAAQGMRSVDLFVNNVDQIAQLLSNLNVGDTVVSTTGTTRKIIGGSFPKYEVSESKYGKKYNTTWDLNTYKFTAAERIITRNSEYSIIKFPKDEIISEKLHQLKVGDIITSDSGKTREVLERDDIFIRVKVKTPQGQTEFKKINISELNTSRIRSITHK